MHVQPQLSNLTAVAKLRVWHTAGSQVKEFAMLELAVWLRANRIQKPAPFIHRETRIFAVMMNFNGAKD